MAEVTLKDLLEAGAHFGHQARRWNPAMAKYIYGKRGGIHIFDLVQTKKGLDEAVEFVKKLTGEGKVILFVGTKRQAAATVKAAAERVGMPYLSVRWIGGLLTNWAQMEKRIRKMFDMKDKREKGEYKKYTKREQILIDREIAKLEKFFGGVAKMGKLPSALFVVDSHREEVAVREAVRMGIPVVALVDSNADPNLTDYVIPGNDDAVKSVELVVGAVADAIAESKSVRVEEQEEKK
ncbi:30S ribosomal protein S2 [Candidatus Amesbacteria bacterium RIFCSPLOWO2_01_FULL_49_25]|uniref:Small ribosomal subunit protein uS2 n=1 Tax=Candidatus Amesbacteria bacterium RIFCSPHIGHO2_01_FULL_48_32b TaxID=1797253 RepID=A0A1F4YH25_9BACT|nr:MAG: 30S ribosomal protein S2 [Candidatus Amesbacteria bacterium RIFCSPHIGHO2_01_FULL_48_32b]OGD07043.1 MAG: 30S ribosomal protein S2 [Candidatus Amesbacteria bacterium RIFCSPLOWO2_01_FULL_49_25]